MLTCCFATREIGRSTSSACTHLALWCRMVTGIATCAMKHSPMWMSSAALTPFCLRGVVTHTTLLRSYVQLQERAVVEYRSMLAAEDDFDLEAASQHVKECAETVFHPDMPKSLKRKIRKKAADLRLSNATGLAACACTTSHG